MTDICKFCDSTLPKDSKFCPSCGKKSGDIIICQGCNTKNSLSSLYCSNCGNNLQTNETANFLSKLFANQFIFSLEEKLVEENNSANINLPYGCFAVLLQNNKVLEVQHSGSYGVDSDSQNIVIDFLKSIVKKVQALFGKQEKKADPISTYIISNLSSLPVIEYEHEIPIIGENSAKIHMTFWLDPDDARNGLPHENVGLFLQNHLKNNSMSFDEFKDICIQTALPLINSNEINTENMADQQFNSLASIENQLFKLIGVSSKVLIKNGIDFNVKTIEVSQYADEVSCPKCNAMNGPTSLQCKDCNHDLHGISEISSQNFLLLNNGKQITLKIKYEEYSIENIDKGTITNSVLNVLSHEISKHDLNSLSDKTIVDGLEFLLNSKLSSRFKNVVGNFEVLDFKDTDSEWVINTEAVVASELRKIKSQHLLLQVSDAKIDLDHAYSSVARRKARKVFEEDLESRKLKLENAKSHHAIDLDEKKQRIKKETEHLELDKELDDIEELMLAKENRKKSDEAIKEHQNALLELERAQELEIQKVTSELEINKIKEKFESDKKLAEELLRQAEFEREQQKADAEQERQLKKLAAMNKMQADLEKEDTKLEIERAESLKDLDPQTILALQAQKLLELGDDKEAANILKAIAENSNVNSEQQKEMYERILAENKDMQKMITDTLLKNNQSMSKLAEKSISSKAEPSSKSKKSGSENDSKSSKIKCLNNECNATFERSAVPDFCTQCGTKINS